jgi:endonuclease/exonuclease/phosphatase family metal-dependent hydrolase
MSDRFRVLSYNIRKAVGLDGTRDPGRVLDVINQTDADLVLLQEADKRLGVRPTALPFDLIEKHSDFDIVRVADNDVSLGWHGNAMLVRKGVTILDTQKLHLPGLEPRGAIMVDIAMQTGAPLRVVGTHLGLLRPWRRKQIETIAAHLARIGGENALVAGDFNEWTATKGLEALAATHDIISPGKSFRSNLPVAGLDRIALGAGLQMEDAGVEDTAIARISSDHLPVWTDVQIPISPMPSVQKKT